MATKQGFSSGVAWLAAGNWTEQVVTFVVFVVLARILGTEAFGILAMASVFVVLSEFLVRETFSEGLIAHAAPAAGDLDATFWLLTGFGLGLGAILWLLATPIARLYGIPDVASLVRALAVTVPLIALTSVPVAILRRELRFRALALRAVAGVVAGGIVGIGMALAGYGVWSLVGQRLVQVLVNVALAWGTVGWRPGRMATWDATRAAGRFGGQVLSLRAAELSAAQLPTLIIGAGLGPHAAGLYSVAWKLIELASFLIVTPLRVAAQPTFAAISRGGGRAADLLLDISALTGLIAFPLFFGLAVTARPALAVIFGPEWAEAAPVLAILSAVGLFFCIEKVQQAFCLAAGEARALASIGWLTTGLVAVCGALALRFGLPAVAAVVVLAYWLPWPLRFRLTARIAGVAAVRLVTPHFAPFAAAAAMAACVLAASYWLAPSSPGRALALAVAVGIVVQIALVMSFFRDRVALLKTFALRPPKAGRDS